MQLSVSLYDGGTPPLVSNATATIVIGVGRDQWAPVFIGAPYNVTIRKDMAPGASVLQTVSFDNDTVV